METQGFFQELSGYLSNDFSFAYLTANQIFAGIGWFIAHFFLVKKALKRKKEHIKAKYWLVDNGIPIVVFMLVVYLFTVFSNEIFEYIKLQEKDSWYIKIVDIVFGANFLLAVIVGFSYEKFLSKKIRKLVNSKFKKGGKMNFIFEFKETSGSMNNTFDDYDAIDLNDAWDHFLAAWPEYYIVISITDENEDVHPTTPPQG